MRANARRTTQIRQRQSGCGSFTVGDTGGGGACTTDSDCPNCHGCVGTGENASCELTEECGSDGDCGSGEVCEDCQCVNDESGGGGDPGSDGLPVGLLILVAAAGIGAYYYTQS